MKKILSTIISSMLLLTSFAGFGQGNAKVPRPNARAGNVQESFCPFKKGHEKTSGRFFAI
jgi:hypothetical protein